MEDFKKDPSTMMEEGVMGQGREQVPQQPQQPMKMEQPMMMGEQMSMPPPPQQPMMMPGQMSMPPVQQAMMVTPAVVQPMMYVYGEQPKPNPFGNTHMTVEQNYEAQCFCKHDVPNIDFSILTPEGGRGEIKEQSDSSARNNCWRNREVKADIRNYMGGVSHRMHQRFGCCRNECSRRVLCCGPLCCKPPTAQVYAKQNAGGYGAAHGRGEVMIGEIRKPFYCDCCVFRNRLEIVDFAVEGADPRDGSLRAQQRRAELAEHGSAPTFELTGSTCQNGYTYPECCPIKHGIARRDNGRQVATLERRPNGCCAGNLSKFNVTWDQDYVRTHGGLSEDSKALIASSISYFWLYSMFSLFPAKKGFCY